MLKLSSFEVISPIINLPQDAKESALIDVKKKSFNEEELLIKG